MTAPSQPYSRTARLLHWSVAGLIVLQYVLARLAFNVFGIADNELSLLRWLGVLSMVVGGLLAAGQKDIKRLFAYSSISQVGFIILGFGLGNYW